MAPSKTKQIWDLFIEAECDSFEKSAWCDIFLAQVLTELRNGKAINDVLTFGNLHGVGTLIACEILGGVHKAVAPQPGDGDELKPLQDYLLNKGWLGLTVLVAMGTLNLSCSSELAHLLLYLYPLCLKNSLPCAENNVYLPLKVAVIEDFSLPRSPIKNRFSGSYVNVSPKPEFNRSYSHSISRSRRALRLGHASPRDESTNPSSDEPALPGALQNAGGFFKLDPMDFDYFTSVVRSEDDARLDTVLYEPARRQSRSSRVNPRDLVDDAIQHVLESSVSPYDFCRLSVQLLTLLASEEHTFPIYPENSFPTCTQCIKFSIENLCNLQFNSVSVPLTDEETAELKVGWTKLLVLCLEKVMGFPDVTCTVLLAGILPMMLRVTEDVISKIEKGDHPDVRGRMEEVVFGLTCGILCFLHNLLFQGSDPDSLRTFLEMMNQTIDSSSGRLLDRAIFVLGQRAGRIVDLLGHLINAIKRFRWRINCPSHKKTRARKLKLIDAHHHFESFGSAQCNSLLPSQPTCCVSNLAMVFFRLMQSQDKIPDEVVNKALAVMATCGTCCCMSIKTPIKALIKVVQQSPAKSRALAFVLFERTIYRQLGAYKPNRITSVCDFCSMEKGVDAAAWEKLDIFQETIMKFDGRQSQSIVCHLIRMAPALKDPLREILLFKVFFPSFVVCKDGYLKEKSENHEFIILSTLSVFSTLLTDSSIARFLSLKGINHTLDLIGLPTFSKQCCAVLERAITCEHALVGNSSEVTSLEMLRKVADSTTWSFLASFGIENGATVAMGKKRGRKESVKTAPEPLEHLQTLVVFWRSFVGLSLSNPELREYFARTTLLEKSNALLIVALEWLAKTRKCLDPIQSDETFFHLVLKLVESLLTFLLVASTPDVEDKAVETIARIFQNCDILQLEVKRICEVFMKCAIAKTSPAVILDAPKMPLMAMAGLHSEDVPEVVVDGEASVSAEEDYVTADEGYDADVELKKNLYFGNESSSTDSESSNIEVASGRLSPVISYPKLCKFVLELLIRMCRERLFDDKEGKANKDGVEKCVAGMLLRLSALCHDNPLNCLSLCGQSIISILLEGFSTCLSDIDCPFHIIRTAVLDLFTNLARVFIAPSELRMYLAFFKNDQPPMTDLLKPLVELVSGLSPKPGFILTFPVLSPLQPESQFEKVIHRSHRSEGIISSWGHAAVLLNIPGSLNWSPWLSGCALSVWVRIDRVGRSFRSQVSRKRSHVLEVNRKISVLSVGRKTSRAESVMSCSTALSDYGAQGGGDEELHVVDRQGQMKNQLHVLSVGSETLSVEFWSDQTSGDMTVRATRVDAARGYEVLAEVTYESGLASGCWHHLAANIVDSVRHKRTIVEVTLILDGQKEKKLQLIFNSLVIRKPRDLCLQLGHQTPPPTSSASFSVSNVMLFRTPLFTRGKALALAALGPDAANLTSCRIAQPVPLISPFIKADNLTDTEWKILMDDSTCGVREAAESLLLAYSAQDPNSLRIYQGAVAGGSMLFRPINTEVSGSQLPSVVSLPSILAPLNCKKDETIASALRLIGGSSVILFLFARVVELNASGEQQANALYILLRLVQSDSHLYSEFINHDYHKLLRKIFLSRFMNLDLHLLKVIMSCCCDKSVIIETNEGMEIDQRNGAVVRNPLLLATLVAIWVDATNSSRMLVAMFSALQSLVTDEHPHREFNACQLNRVRIMTILLNFCKEQTVREEKAVVGEEVWKCVVEVVRSLMGSPPDLPHIVDAVDTLLMLHPANHTYITHLKNSFYLQISAGQSYSHNSSVRSSTSQDQNVAGYSGLDKWVHAVKTNQSENEDFASPVDSTKLSKALANLELKRLAEGSQTSTTTEESFSMVSDSGISDHSNENANVVRALDGSSQNLSSFVRATSSSMANESASIPEEGEKCVSDALQKEDGEYVVSEGLLLLLRDVLLILPDNMAPQVLSHVVKLDVLLVMANHPSHFVRTAVVQLLSSYLKRAGEEETSKFLRMRGFHHLANQIALFPASYQLAEACFNLLLPCFVALDDPNFIGQMDLTAGMLLRLPPLMALLPRSVHDSLLVHHVINVLRMIFCKNGACARSLVDHGLVEVLVKSLLASAHLASESKRITTQDVVVADIQAFIILLGTHFIVTPGISSMQVVCDLRLELEYVGRVEQESCGGSSRCVRLIRETQSQLFDRCLDHLLERLLNLKTDKTPSTLFSLGIHSCDDRVGTCSISSSISSQSLGYAAGATGSKDLSKGELKERLGAVIGYSSQFLINEATTDLSTIALGQSEQDFVRHFFPMLLQMMCGIMEKKSYGRRCGLTAMLWSLRDTLRTETAELLVWLICPRLPHTSRLLAVNSLLVCPKTKDIVSSLLQVHPQIEQKFTVFLWQLMYNSKLSGSDLRTCLELKENLQQWGVLSPHAIGNSHDAWGAECNMLLAQMDRQRGAWEKNSEAAIMRCVTKYDSLVKVGRDDAMLMTRMVVDAQNVERKTLMTEIRQKVSADVTTTARWRALVEHLTHPAALWHDPRAQPHFWQLDPTEATHRVRTRLAPTSLNISARFLKSDHRYKLESLEHRPPLAYLFERHRETCPSAVVIERLHCNEKIRSMSAACVITPAHEVPGELLLGESSLYFVADDKHLCSTLDVDSTAWPFEDVREVHHRRFQLKERAIELFLRTGRTYLLAFNTSEEKDVFAATLSECDLPNLMSSDSLAHSTSLWRERLITNFEYLTQLNKISGRSFNDLMQYPVFPFVLSDYVSATLDLTNPRSFRNLKKPMAVQDKQSEQHYINNYNELVSGLKQVSLNREPYHYGSHYSNSGTVLHFLVRLPPFTNMLLHYQDRNFDLPDRTFHNLATTWRLTSLESTTDVKELIPEFFYNPEFLLNSQGFDFGIRQNEKRVDDVELPPWCNQNARNFILIHRQALESDVVSENLAHWIDLVFGYKQTGKAAVDAINVFHPATYYGFDVSTIQDPVERVAWETMVRTYGQTPRQLFTSPHPLVIQSLLPPTRPYESVLKGVVGLKWGSYVGSPQESEPRIAWKHAAKDHSPTASLLPLTTNDVFALPPAAVCLTRYTKEKGFSLINSTSVRAAIVTWSHPDGIIRAKVKKEQPLEPILQVSPFDPVTVCSSAPEAGQLWLGHVSGSISVLKYSFRHDRHSLDFAPLPLRLQAHRSPVSAIAVSRHFSIVITASRDGTLILWDLNTNQFVRSVQVEGEVTLVTVSSTLGDIACSSRPASATQPVASFLHVYTVNASLIGVVAVSDAAITSLCFSSAPEGVSVNVIAAGLANGVIRLWNTWNLSPVRDIRIPSYSLPIISLAYSHDSQHLYAGCADGTVVVWESSTVKYDSHPPKFLNLKTVL